MGTFTNLGFSQPTPGDPAVRNAWGTILNTDMTLEDNAISGILSKSVAGSSNVILTSTQGAANEFRNCHYILTGVLTGNIYVLLPSGVTFPFTVENNTTGAFTLGIGANSGGSPAGTTVTVAQGTKVFLLSNGTNVVTRTSYAVGPVANSDLADMAQSTIKGRAVSGGTGDPTDLTAAQAAAIIGSVGGALMSKVITFTRITNAASGNVAYTGVGFQPSSVIFIGCNQGGGGPWNVGIAGASLAGGCLRNNGDASAFMNTAAIPILISNDGDASSQQGVINSFDADGFTLGWTKAGSPGAVTWTFYALCFR